MPVRTRVLVIEGCCGIPFRSLPAAALLPALHPGNRPQPHCHGRGVLLPALPRRTTMLRKLQLHKALLLSAALLSATACMPAFGRSLVDIDVVDRDTGQWL